MKKALVFIDYDFYCDYLDEHNIGYEPYDIDTPMIDVGNVFTGQAELPLEYCGMDYMILDCNVSEDAALKIIDNRLKSAYGVKNLEKVLSRVEFWPSSKYQAIPNLPPRKTCLKPTLESLIKEGVPLYKIEFNFSLNFYENYEEDYPFLKQEGINMPAYQFEREIKMLDEVIEVRGLDIICRGDAHKVISFIEKRLPVLAREGELSDVGFLTCAEYPAKP